MTTTNAVGASAPTDSGAINEAALRDSLSSVLNVLTDRQNTPASLQFERMSEDVLFTALIHEQLGAQKPELAKQFIRDLKSSYQANLKQHKRQSLTQAAQGLLDKMTSAGKLQQKTAQSMVKSAFGKAQLDNNAATLARKPADIYAAQGAPADKSAVDLTLSRALENGAASARDLNKFEKRIEKNPILGNRRFNAQKGVLEEIYLKSAGVAAKPIDQAPPGPGTSDVKKNSEADLPDPQKSYHDIVTGPDELVYKPESERDGKILVWVPLRYKEQTSGVELYSGEDTRIEELIHAGKSEDGRGSFRGGRKGSEIAGSGFIRLKFLNGTRYDIEIDDFGKYFQRTYRRD